MVDGPTVSNPYSMSPVVDAQQQARAYYSGQSSAAYAYVPQSPATPTWQNIFAPKQQEMGGVKAPVFYGPVQQKAPTITAPTKVSAPTPTTSVISTPKFSMSSFTQTPQQAYGIQPMSVAPKETTTSQAIVSQVPKAVQFATTTVPETIIQAPYRLMQATPSLISTGSFAASQIGNQLRSVGDRFFTPATTITQELTKAAVSAAPIVRGAGETIFAPAESLTRQLTGIAEPIGKAISSRIIQKPDGTLEFVPLVSDEYYRSRAPGVREKISSASSAFSSTFIEPARTVMAQAGERVFAPAESLTRQLTGIAEPIARAIPSIPSALTLPFKSAQSMIDRYSAPLPDYQRMSIAPEIAERQRMAYAIASPLKRAEEGLSEINQLTQKSSIATANFLKSEVAPAIMVPARFAKAVATAPTTAGVALAKEFQKRGGPYGMAYDVLTSVAEPALFRAGLSSRYPGIESQPSSAQATSEQLRKFLEPTAPKIPSPIPGRKATPVTFYAPEIAGYAADYLQRVGKIYDLKGELRAAEKQSEPSTPPKTWEEGYTGRVESYQKALAAAGQRSERVADFFGTGFTGKERPEGGWGRWSLPALAAVPGQMLGGGIEGAWLGLRKIPLLAEGALLAEKTALSKPPTTPAGFETSFASKIPGGEWYARNVLGRAGQALQPMKDVLYTGPIKEGTWGRALSQAYGPEGGWRAVGNVALALLGTKMMGDSMAAARATTPMVNKYLNPKTGAITEVTEITPRLQRSYVPGEGLRGFFEKGEFINKRGESMSYTSSAVIPESGGPGTFLTKITDSTGKLLGANKGTIKDTTKVTQLLSKQAEGEMGPVPGTSLFKFTQDTATRKSWSPFTQKQEREGTIGVTRTKDVKEWTTGSDVTFLDKPERWWDSLTKQEVAQLKKSQATAVELQGQVDRPVYISRPVGGAYNVATRYGQRGGAETGTFLQRRTDIIPSYERPYDVIGTIESRSPLLRSLSPPGGIYQEAVSPSVSFFDKAGGIVTNIGSKAGSAASKAGGAASKLYPSRLVASRTGESSSMIPGTGTGWGDFTNVMPEVTWKPMTASVGKLAARAAPKTAALTRGQGMTAQFSQILETELVPAATKLSPLGATELLTPTQTGLYGALGMPFPSFAGTFGSPLNIFGGLIGPSGALSSRPALLEKPSTIQSPSTPAYPSIFESDWRNIFGPATKETPAIGVTPGVTTTPGATTQNPPDVVPLTIPVYISTPATATTAAPTTVIQTITTGQIPPITPSPGIIPSLGLATKLPFPWIGGGFGMGGEGGRGAPQLRTTGGVNVNYLRNFFFEKVALEKPTALKGGAAIISGSLPSSLTVGSSDFSGGLSRALGKDTSSKQYIATNSAPFDRASKKRLVKRGKYEHVFNQFF